MVSCCANRDCCAHYRGSRGELYSIERSTGMEFFWLCSVCAARCVLSFDSEGSVSVRRSEVGSVRRFRRPAAVAQSTFPLAS